MLIAVEVAMTEKFDLHHSKTSGFSPPLISVTFVLVPTYSENLRRCQVSCVTLSQTNGHPYQSTKITAFLRLMGERA